MTRIPKLQILIVLAFVLYVAILSASAATLTRGPYLQLQTENSIHIVWKTDVACTGEVEWGTTSSYGHLAQSAESVTRHEIAITGLAADMLYHYRVRSVGVPLSDDATFRTAPPRNASVFSFTIQGDSRSAPSNCKKILDAMLPETFNGFCISLGDLPGRGEDNITDYWQSHFFNPAKDFVNHICLYPTIGNHELYDETSYPDYVYPTKYLEIWSLPIMNSSTELYYAFDKGDAHYTCLDVYWSEYKKGSEQYNWLVNDISATTKKWKIVFMHNGPYVSRNGGATGSSSIRSNLVPVFEQNTVDLVLYAHYHIYQRNLVNEITYLVQGCGGASLGPVDDSQPYVQAYYSDYCFTRIDIDGDTLLGTTHLVSGTIVDGFEIDKTPVNFPWRDTFPGTTPQLHWIAPWHFSSECGVIQNLGNPSGDGYVFAVADTVGHQYAYPMLANETLTDYSIEAQIYYDNTISPTYKNRFGIGLRGTGFPSSSTRLYYVLAFMHGSSLAENGHCVLLLNNYGTETVLADWAYPDVASWHKLKLSAKGDALSVWIDGVCKTPALISDSTAVKGRPFIYNYRADSSGAKTLADDVVITDGTPPHQVWQLY